MKETETSQRSEDKPDGKNFRMIDVGGKESTQRRAVAQGRIIVGAAAFERIKNKTVPKGDVIALAEIAGILAAKKTPEMIPLCHPLPIEVIEVRCKLEPKTHSVLVEAMVGTSAKTGVEMEALSAVNSALLSIYDLTKAIEPVLTISDIRLNTKTGGKHGDWTHPDHTPTTKRTVSPTLTGISAAVVTISDRASKGEREDLSGPILCKLLEIAGAESVSNKLIADEPTQIVETLLNLVQNEKIPLIITTGGTGLGPRDRTIQTLRKIASKEIPGIGELLRSSGAAHIKSAWLSESMGFVVENSIVIALPGSKNAVKEGWDVLGDLLPHALHVLHGGDHK